MNDSKEIVCPNCNTIVGVAFPPSIQQWDDFTVSIVENSTGSNWTKLKGVPMPESESKTESDSVLEGRWEHNSNWWARRWRRCNSEKTRLNNELERLKSILDEAGISYTLMEE